MVKWNVIKYLSPEDNEFELFLWESPGVVSHNEDLSMLVAAKFSRKSFNRDKFKKQIDVAHRCCLLSVIQAVISPWPERSCADIMRNGAASSTTSDWLVKC